MTDVSQVSDGQLETLIDGMKQGHLHGASQAWRLRDGTVIDVLAILYELQAFRRQVSAHASR